MGKPWWRGLVAVGLNAGMTDAGTVAVRIVAGSLAELRDFLGIEDEVPAGRIMVGDGVVLEDVRVGKSSGFEGTQFVLETVVSMASTVTSGVLTAWLTERLKSRPRVSATVDGAEVPAPPEPPSAIG